MGIFNEIKLGMVWGWEAMRMGGNGMKNFIPALLYFIVTVSLSASETGVFMLKFRLSYLNHKNEIFRPCEKLSIMEGKKLANIGCR